MIKCLYLFASLSLGLILFPIQVKSQIISGGDGTIYENRSCYPRPGTTGTECVIENPLGLCTEKSVCA